MSVWKTTAVCDIEHLLFGYEQTSGIGYPVNSLYICMNNDACKH